MQDTTENSHYTELGVPLRLELNSTYLLEDVAELIVMGERMFLVSITKFGVVGENI